MKKIVIFLVCLCFGFLLAGCGEHDHQWVNGVITKSPTETEYGEMVLSCKHCSATSKRIIDKLPHNHSFAAEWEKNEIKHWHSCTVENCTVTSESQAHLWNEGEVITPSTQTTVGKKKYTCTVCSATRELAYTAVFTVTGEELDSALLKDAFTNVTLIYKKGDKTYNLKIANGMVECESDGTVTKEEDTQQSLFGSYAISDMLTRWGLKYGDFTYDERQRAYIYAGDGLKSSMQFADGTLVFASFITDGSVETYSFSAYGKTTVEEYDAQ